MYILRNSNQDHLRLLGPNYKNDTNPRFLNFLIVVNIDGGKVIHNELTRSLIWISNEEWSNLLVNNLSNIFNWLWDNYFLVNENYDEYVVQEYLRKTYRPKYDDKTYLQPGHIRTFTILTTTACNARCFYCYEKGQHQYPMKSETTKKVASYIVDNGIKTGDPIHLRWFGGEPLVNENAIDIICQKLQNTGFNYDSSMTTNGFLFKEEKIQKYKDLWHLNSCQITIDGSENVYNKTKNYKNVKGLNPYQIVCKNIEMLINNEINVGIRINIDEFNIDDIKNLIPDLFNRFGHHSYFHIYTFPVFEDPNNPRTEEEVKTLYERLDEANEILDKYGYLSTKSRDIHIAHVQCMTDDGQSVVINPNGDVGVCEHYLDSEFYTHIDTPEIRNNEVLKKFHEYEEHYELCKDCPIKPSCIKLSMCRDLRSCDKYHKQWQIKNAVLGVRQMYQEWKYNQPNKQQLVYKQTNNTNTAVNSNKQKKKKSNKKKHK